MCESKASRCVTPVRGGERAKGIIWRGSHHLITPSADRLGQQRRESAIGTEGKEGYETNRV